MGNEYAIATRCIYNDVNSNDGENSYGAISYPIYQTATFAHKGVGKSSGFDYSRLQNPTRAHLEEVVASLEHGVDAVAFTTGMAAVTLLMDLFQPGDHIIADSDLYGGSIRLFDHVCGKNGIHFTRVDCTKADVESLVRENTKAIYVETPTNPMMGVLDIAKLSTIAKRHDLLLIVDNTFLSPYFQNPIDLGADLVVHSGTKFLGGHNDTLAGFLVAANEELAERIRFLIKTVGSGLPPFDSWLILRGIKTLPLRMEKAQENAQKIVEWLLVQDCVRKVYYPGIPGSEGYEICKKQARGFGSMITFEVESPELAQGILERVKLIRFAESLGGVESLITYPVTQTHADVPEEIRLANGITDSVLRLSVGIEDSRDLIHDLAQAFD